jgi:ketol-acid reductoisomerase
MSKMFYDADIDESLIKSKKIAILGCGSQGHAQALNLKESGADVVVGLKKGSKTWKKAEKAGLIVKETAEAAAWGDVKVLLLPDTAQEAIYNESIKPSLKAGDSLVFAHGFNIRYNKITPPSDIDVWLVAPKSPGHRVRTTYVQGFGVPALFAVEQDATGNAQKLSLGYAKLIGSGRVGILETTFTEETETDLFGEQAVLCGGTSELVKAGFETLVEAGYQPEVAYFECLHELKLIVDLMAEGGLSAMRYSISDTAEYGDYVSGPRIIDASVKARMRDVLKDIKNGKFADDFTRVMANDAKELKAIREKESIHQIEEVGAKLRSMMRMDSSNSGDDNFNASCDK